MAVKYFGSKTSESVPTEMAEMMTFFNFLRLNHPDISRLATHIKNEGKRTASQVVFDRASGMLKGFSDIVIIGNPPFVCEMKSRSKTSRLSKDQIEFLNRADAVGAFACVAYGKDGAVLALNEWINITCLKTTEKHTNRHVKKNGAQ